MAEKTWDQLSPDEKSEAIRRDLRKIMSILNDLAGRIADIEKKLDDSPKGDA